MRLKALLQCRYEIYVLYSKLPTFSCCVNLPCDVLGLAVEPRICEQAGPACDPGPRQKCHKSEIVHRAQLNCPTLTRRPRKFPAEQLLPLSHNPNESKGCRVQFHILVHAKVKEITRAACGCRSPDLYADWQILIS